VVSLKCSELNYVSRDITVRIISLEIIHVLFIVMSLHSTIRGRRGCNRTLVGFTTTYAISAYHHLSYEFGYQSWRGVPDTTLCDKVCQWLATGLWFFRSTPVSSTNKTDRHDITEILLNVALSTITTHTHITMHIDICILLNRTGMQRLRTLTKLYLYISKTIDKLRFINIPYQMKVLSDMITNCWWQVIRKTSFQNTNQEPGDVKSSHGLWGRVRFSADAG
jgi:hypothetical protein